MKRLIKTSGGLLVSSYILGKLSNSAPLNVQKNTSVSLGIASLAMPIYSSKFIINQVKKL